MEIILYIVVGLVTGIAIGLLISVLGNLKKRSNFETQKNELEKTWQTKIFDFEKENSLLKDRNQTLSEDKKNLDQELQTLRSDNEHLNQRLAVAKNEYRNLTEKLESQKAEIEELQKKFTTEFENIANKILKKNSEEFTVANQKNMGELLKPIKEKFETFEKKVEDTYQKGLKDQVDLKAELKKLSELNHKISEEAQNLTKALKGDVKKQGNWGEIILERILERSGLVEGQEYQKQYSDHSEDGKRIQPDIIIDLPDKKHIIIDSKVSLVAYERAVNAQNENDRTVYLKEHIISIKNHIKGLSEKHYQTARGLNSPDFVLLFIPIESSFGMAVQEDQELFAFAWDQKVVIVSPSTLLATLKTIASIWQQENQTKNAIEIARQGGALYDKFVGFINDMEKIGNNLSSTQKVYNDAMNKLQAGSGNLVKRVENLKKLGAKSAKELPSNMLEE